MSKVSTFCIISFFLFLTLSCAVARPVATFHDVTPMETENSLSVQNNGKAVEEGSICEGLGEDECMMRRSLEAHIDYIYTQNHNQP